MGYDAAVKYRVNILLFFALLSAFGFAPGRAQMPLFRSGSDRLLQVSSAANNPVMDIRMRELSNICYGDSSVLDLVMEVRTTEGSSRAILQIQDAVVFDAVLGSRVTSVQSIQWGLPADNYVNEYKWTRSERVLEFRSTHQEPRPFSSLGGPAAGDWHVVAIFRIGYQSLAGSMAGVAWYAGTPNYNVSALQTPGPGIETIHNLEMDTISQLPMDCSADISMRGRVNNNMPFQGQQITFCFIAANHGPSDALQIIFDDDLKDADFAYISHVTPNGTYDWQNHRWAVSSLRHNATDTLWLTVQIRNVGLLTVNMARMSSTPVDPVSSNDRTSISVLGKAASDIAVRVGVDVPNPCQGQNVVFDVLATDFAGSDANSIQIRIAIPPGFTYSGHLGGLYDHATGIWSIPSLALGVSDTLKLYTKAKIIGVWSFLACRVASSPPDYNAVNDQATVDVAIQASARIFVRLYLEGAFRLARTDTTGIDTSYMACRLRYQPRNGFCSLIPVYSPYADHRDAEALDSDHLPERVVDWLYVQFRPGNSGGYGVEIPLDSGANGISCFLRNDGALIDIHGEEGVLVPALPPGSYYIMITHRNHLKVMTASAVNTMHLTGYNFDQTEKQYYDFTEAQDRYFTKSEHDQRGCALHSVDGKWMIAAGDGDQGQQVENEDWDQWFGADGMLIGYFDCDYDLGGQVEGRDETLWYDNLSVRSPFSWEMTGP